MLSQGVQNSKTNAYLCFPTYYLLVASAVEKEDGAAQDAVDEGEGAVQPRVLLIGGQGAQQKTHKHHRHDDQVGSLDEVLEFKKEKSWAELGQDQALLSSLVR